MLLKPAGQVELVTCTPVTTGAGRHRKTVQKCTSKLMSSPVTFTTAASIAVVLSRDGIVYATGSAGRSGSRTRLLLTPRRALSGGRYTLTLIRKGKRAPVNETIAIG